MGEAMTRLSGKMALQMADSRGDEVRTSRLHVNRDLWLSDRWRPKLGKLGVIDSQWRIKCMACNSMELEGSRKVQSK